jgi:hypothetical protein
MPNPSLLICDSDVLIQLFLAGEVRPLRDLKDLYGVQPAIVQEVDVELRWVGHYGPRFVPQLDKSLKSGIVAHLDQPHFQSLLSAAPPGASWAGFQSLGAQYMGIVDKGEAYTHAAGVVLAQPTASDDFRAIEVLQFQMQNLPSPVLRSFDLLGFAFESGTLHIDDCEKVRSCLLKERRWLPVAFKRASFADGMANFPLRLRDASKAIPLEPRPPTAFSDPLFITRI